MIAWQRQPAALEQAMLDHIAKVERAVIRAAERLSTILEQSAQADAPWQDRTGDARKGLFSAVEVAAGMVTIYLSHGVNVDYGKWLETLRGGKYAIILATIERHMDEIFSLIQAELGQ